MTGAAIGNGGGSGASIKVPDGTGVISIMNARGADGVLRSELATGA